MESKDISVIVKTKLEDMTIDFPVRKLNNVSLPNGTLS